MTLILQLIDYLYRKKTLVRIVKKYTENKFESNSRTHYDRKKERF